MHAATVRVNEHAILHVEVNLLWYLPRPPSKDVVSWNIQMERIAPHSNLKDSDKGETDPTRIERSLDVTWTNLTGNNACFETRIRALKDIDVDHDKPCQSFAGFGQLYVLIPLSNENEKEVLPIDGESFVTQTWLVTLLERDVLETTNPSTWGESIVLTRRLANLPWVSPNQQQQRISQSGFQQQYPITKVQLQAVAYKGSHPSSEGHLHLYQSRSADSDRARLKGWWTWQRLLQILWELVSTSNVHEKEDQFWMFLSVLSVVYYTMAWICRSASKRLETTRPSEGILLPPPTPRRVEIQSPGKFWQTTTDTCLGTEDLCDHIEDQQQWMYSIPVQSEEDDYLDNLGNDEDDESVHEDMLNQYDDTKESMSKGQSISPLSCVEISRQMEARGPAHSIIQKASNDQDNVHADQEVRLPLILESAEEKPEPDGILRNARDGDGEMILEEVTNDRLSTSRLQVTFDSQEEYCSRHYISCSNDRQDSMSVLEPKRVTFSPDVGVLENDFLCNIRQSNALISLSDNNRTSVPQDLSGQQCANPASSKGNIAEVENGRETFLSVSDSPRTNCGFESANVQRNLEMQDCHTLRQSPPCLQNGSDPIAGIEEVSLVEDKLKELCNSEATRKNDCESSYEDHCLPPSTGFRFIETLDSEQSESNLGGARVQSPRCSIGSELAQMATTVENVLNREKIPCNEPFQNASPSATFSSKDTLDGNLEFEADELHIVATTDNNNNNNNTSAIATEVNVVGNGLANAKYLSWPVEVLHDQEKDSGPDDKAESDDNRQLSIDDEMKKSGERMTKFDSKANAPMINTLPHIIQEGEREDASKANAHNPPQIDADGTAMEQLSANASYVAEKFPSGRNPIADEGNEPLTSNQEKKDSSTGHFTENTAGAWDQALPSCESAGSAKDYCPNSPPKAQSSEGLNSFKAFPLIQSGSLMQCSEEEHIQSRKTLDCGVLLYDFGSMNSGTQEQPIESTTQNKPHSSVANLSELLGCNVLQEGKSICDALLTSEEPASQMACLLHSSGQKDITNSVEANSLKQCHVDDFNRNQAGTQASCVIPTYNSCTNLDEVRLDGNTKGVKSEQIPKDKKFLSQAFGQDGIAPNASFAEKLLTAIGHTCKEGMHVSSTSALSEAGGSVAIFQGGAQPSTHRKLSDGLKVRDLERTNTQQFPEQAKPNLLVYDGNRSPSDQKASRLEVTDKISSSESYVSTLPPDSHCSTEEPDTFDFVSSLASPRDFEQPEALSKSKSSNLKSLGPIETGSKSKSIANKDFNPGVTSVPLGTIAARGERKRNRGRNVADKYPRLSRSSHSASVSAKLDRENSTSGRICRSRNNIESLHKANRPRRKRNREAVEKDYRISDRNDEVVSPPLGKKTRPFSNSSIVPDWVPSTGLQSISQKFEEDIPWNLSKKCFEPSQATIPKSILLPDTS